MDATSHFTEVVAVAIAMNTILFKYQSQPGFSFAPVAATCPAKNAGDVRRAADILQRFDYIGFIFQGRCLWQKLLCGILRALVKGL